MSFHAAKHAGKALLGDEKSHSRDHHVRRDPLFSPETDSTNARNESLVVNVMIGGAEYEKNKCLFCDVHKRGIYLNINPGTELFSQAATHQVSSPLQRFTSEFGMESVWFHRAKSTRKAGLGATSP